MGVIPVGVQINTLTYTYGTRLYTALGRRDLGLKAIFYEIDLSLLNSSLAP